MKKHVVMIIANSPNPSYFNWFAELNFKENACKISYIFLHTENPPLAEKVKQFNVNSHWIYFNTYRRKPFQYIKVFFKLFFLFKKIKPDIVQTNLFDDSLPSLFAAKLAGIKKRIITKQDTGYHITYKPSVVKFDKFNNRNATHLIAVSEESKEFILNNEKGDENKITLIHHGVDEDFITTATKEQIISIEEKYKLKDRIVVGTVARYIELKGYADLISAIEQLKNKYPTILFLGIGYGALQPELQKTINHKEIQNHFILTGLIDYHLIPAAYKCMRLYVHAAKIEPFGFVLAEAMFNKIPIITTSVGAARDVLVHKESAYTIKYNSPQDIIEGIDYMLNTNSEILAQKGYELAKENFTRKRMWSSYKTLFIT